MSRTQTTNTKIRQTADAAFVQSFEAKQVGLDVSRFITNLGNNGKSQLDAAWWGSTPMPEELTEGPIPIKPLKEYSYTIAPKDYGIGQSWKRSTFDDDQTGTAAERARTIANRTAAFTAKLFTELLEAGNGSTINTAYDGQNFYSNTHAESGTNQDNLLTGSATTPAAPTVAEFELLVKTVDEYFLGLTDDQGNPLFVDLSQVWLMLPNNYAHVASKVLGASGTAGFTSPLPGDETGTSGYLRNQRKWFANPWLSSTTVMFGLVEAGNGFAGPVVENARESWRFSTWFPEDDPKLFDEDEILMKARRRFRLMYGMWQNSCHLTVS